MSRIDIRSIRREQIVDAAVAVIAEQGLPHLSLSEIEKKTGMRRGHLLYYFKSKEEILVAVFDRTTRMMKARAEAGDGPVKDCLALPEGWDRMSRILSWLLLMPPASDFHALQYTFLSQIGHREDYRERLASLYNEWRGHMSRDAQAELVRRPGPHPSPRTVASLVQAILHGMAVQRAADPNAFDPQEMHDLVLSILQDYFRPGEAPKRENGPARRSRRGPTKPEKR
jgi:AcrR family transcriptional regulator